MTAGWLDLAAASVCAFLAVVIWPPRPRPWRLVDEVWLGRRKPRMALSEPGVSETLDHLSLALRGGAGVQPALREVAAASPGATRAELMAVAAAMAWGWDHDAAWAQAPPHWAPARRALLLASQAGVAPSPMLTSAAMDLRRDQLAQIGEATAQLSVRLVLPLGLAFLPAFVLTTVVPVVLALAATVLDIG